MAIRYRGKISSDDGDNNNVLKLYHLNDQESITKDMIKKIIKAIGL